MKTKKLDHINQLKNELNYRIRRNPSYSLRAFAKSLDVNIGTISAILNLKRPLSMKMAQKIISKINWNNTERNEFLESVDTVQKKRILKKPLVSKNSFIANPVENDVFEVMGDWFYCAILELTYLDGFIASQRWISKKIGISELQAKLALDKLIKLGLLVEKNGKWTKTNKNLETSKKALTTSALKRLQKQFLEKAIDAIDQQAYEKRYSRGMTMAIDPEKLELARDLINDFSHSLCDILENNQSKNKEIYQLSINLFGLEK